MLKQEAKKRVAISAKDVVVEYGKRNKTLQAVAGVSLDIAQGETLGIVGESGCGKSSLGRAILQLHRPASGTVELFDEELTTLSGTELQNIRKDLQVILQDPVSSINPRRKVIDVVSEGLAIHGVDKKEAREKAKKALHDVGMDAELVGDRYAHQFSGGQCQRIAIARAMALEPKVLICDEPVASLDVSIQAQVLNILTEMRERYGLAMIFISHDLSVVMNVCDRVAVMYLGKIVEIGTTEQIYNNPKHPYTKILLDSVPKPDPLLKDDTPGIKGEIPSPEKPPSGCRFRTRCPIAKPVCAEIEPLLEHNEDSGGEIACHFPLNKDSDLYAEVSK